MPAALQTPARSAAPAARRGQYRIVIEHNLDVIKTADWVIDLGPEGGDGGGQIVAEGTPEQITRAVASFTGRYLKRVLARARSAA